MPYRELFRPVADATATELFYSVAFHEVGHATGHECRLARNLKARFGDATYAAEELVAELCSVFVMAELGLAHEPKHNAQEYLAHWLRILRADTKALMIAAAKASAAVEHRYAAERDVGHLFHNRALDVGANRLAGGVIGASNQVSRNLYGVRLMWINGARRLPCCLCGCPPDFPTAEPSA
jgi:hypothetical protein